MRRMTSKQPVRPTSDRTCALVFLAGLIGVATGVALCSAVSKPSQAPAQDPTSPERDPLGLLPARPAPPSAMGMRLAMSPSLDPYTAPTLVPTSLAVGRSLNECARLGAEAQVKRLLSAAKRWHRGSR